MRRSPRNLKITCNHRGLTHYGGVCLFHEFVQVLHFRQLASWHLSYSRRNHDYSLPQMLLALIYPVILGLDRLETASFLRANGTFQYLTGLPNYPDPQSLRRFLLQAPPEFREQLHRFNNRLLRQFISYDPLLCLEANSSFLWDTELRPGDAGTWAGSRELLASSFLSIPSDIRELRVRADAGFGYGPVLEVLEERQAQYAVVARMTATLKRALGGLRYERLNPRWEIGEVEHRTSEGAPTRRCVVARRPIEESDPEPTLFTLARYLYRAWITNLPLTSAGVWHFYDGRAGMEPRIRGLREDFALRKIPTRAFAANALYLEVVRLAYNLVTAFQRTCLPEEWQNLTLSKLRYRLFWLPGELIRPQNRPTLRLAYSRAVEGWTDKILRRIHKLKPLNG